MALEAIIRSENVAKEETMSRRTGIGVALAAIVMTIAASAGTANAKEFYKMATLGPGSAPYIVMTTFANIVNKHLKDAEIQVDATGAATRHMVDGARGQLDFFMYSPSIFQFMQEGSRMYQKVEGAPELAKDLRLLFNFPIGLYHIVTYADSGIERLEDVKGKRVFVGPPGGGATVISLDLIEGATDLVAGKDYEAVTLGWEAGAQAFQDRQVAVYINPTNVPSPVIQQFTLTRNVRLLPLTDAHIARDNPKLKSLLGRPGGIVGDIDPRDYGTNLANTGTVRALGSIVGIAVSKNLPDDVVYQMAKTWWENLKEAHGAAPWMKQIRLQDALIEANMPLHPGAVKYYKEVGLKIPDNLMPSAK
jgi:hypothetical protein